VSNMHVSVRACLHGTLPDSHWVVYEKVLFVCVCCVLYEFYIPSHYIRNSVVDVTERPTKRIIPLSHILCYEESNEHVRQA